jgi:phosphoserine phosphatase RsbU/P
MEKIGTVTPIEVLPSQALGKIASSYHYVLESTSVEELFLYINESEIEITSLAIVDKQMRPKSVIDRYQISTVLKNPFGRDLMKYRTVEAMAEERAGWMLREHIFVVADQLEEVLKQKDEKIFLIVDEEHRYQGTFSTIDLLSYMSDMTQKDISLAHSVQRRIVRERQSVLTTHLEVVASSSTAKGVGGDFYSVKKTGDSTWFIAICDVSGKGVAASLVSAMLHGSVETFDFERNSLAAFVRHLNHTVFSTFEGDKYLTGIFMLLNEETGSCTILDMGHSFFGLLREEKFLKVDTDSGNLPIGIAQRIEVKPSTISLQRKDMIILVTDGLTEQQNLKGEEYSLQRLFRTIRRYKMEGPESIRDRIRSDFNIFRGDAPYHDDVTFMLIRYPDISEVEEDLDPSHTIQWDIA